MIAYSEDAIGRFAAAMMRERFADETPHRVALALAAGYENYVELGDVLADVPIYEIVAAVDELMRRDVVASVTYANGARSIVIAPPDVPLHAPRRRGRHRR